MESVYSGIPLFIAQSGGSAGPSFGWYFIQTGVEFIAVFAGQSLRFSFSSTFQIAEQFGIGFPILIPSHKPTVGGTGVDP